MEVADEFSFFSIFLFFFFFIHYVKPVTNTNNQQLKKMKTKEITWRWRLKKYKISVDFQIYG